MKRRDLIVAPAIISNRSKEQISEEAKSLNTPEHLNRARGAEIQRIFGIWEKLKSTYSETDIEALKAGDLTPVEALIGSVIDGLYPPPEVLISLSECFEFYFNAGGVIELEEVFFGKPKRGVGIYGKRLARDSLCYTFHANWAVHQLDKTDVSQRDLAEELLDSLPIGHPDRDMDIEAFLLRWRRWRNKRE